MSKQKKKSDPLPCPAYGITLPAKPHIGRSGRSSALPYPPIWLKAIIWYRSIILLSMYNLAVEGVQFRATTLFSLQRRGCSIHNGRGVQHRRRIQGSSAWSSTQTIDIVEPQYSFVVHIRTSYNRFFPKGRCIYYRRRSYVAGYYVLTWPDYVSLLARFTFNLQ